MQARLAIMMLSAAALAGGAAHAATSVQIRQAVARVTVVPEDRADVVVDLVRANPRLPISITTDGDTVRVEGRVGVWGMNCHTRFGRTTVSIWGQRDIGWDDMPQIVVHTPRQVKVGAAGAVFGAVGRSTGLELAASGCGDWTIADSSGHMRLGLSGSGDVHAGQAQSVEVGISGAGDVFLRGVTEGLTGSIAGSGDLTVDQMNGPLRVHIAGSGDFLARGGQVGDMAVSIAGSGDAVLRGVAQSLTAQIAGSGDVHVTRVVGPVVRRVVGSGDVIVGS